MNFKRILKHLFTPPILVGQYFPKVALKRIAEAIAISESRHTGELRFAVEHALQLKNLLANQSPRQRAVELFGRYNIWDTEHNNGVLIYLLLADRKIEIVADRGVSKLVSNDGWQAICREIEAHLQKGHFDEGIIHGINLISEHLAEHFPATEGNPNELSNDVIIVN